MKSARRGGCRSGHVSSPLHAQGCPGDAFLLAVRSVVPNHAAVYLGDNKILHHVLGRLSNLENYGGMWKHMTVAHLRHPEVAAKVLAAQAATPQVDLMDHLTPAMKVILRQGK